jgi:sulfur-carrier protein
LNQPVRSDYLQPFARRLGFAPCLPVPLHEIPEFSMPTTQSVTLHLPGMLRVYAGGRAQLSLEAADLRMLLRVIERDLPLLYPNLCEETGAVRRHLNVFVNADNTRDLASGLDTPLSDADIVTFLPAVSGG